MPEITPFLWFDNEAEAAAKLYTSIFPNSKITGTSRFEGQAAEFAQRAEGSVMTVSFELDGKPFVALNGGPMYKINEAVSFWISCDSQAEIDHYWGHLIEGGKELACGWLLDRFGLCWQVVPAEIGAWMAHPKNGSVVAAALMEMVKLDFDRLKSLAEQE